MTYDVFEIITTSVLIAARALYDNIPAAQRDMRVANRMITAALGIRKPRSAPTQATADQDLEQPKNKSKLVTTVNNDKINIDDNNSNNNNNNYNNIDDNNSNNKDDVDKVNTSIKSTIDSSDISDNINLSDGEVGSSIPDLKCTTIADDSPGNEILSPSCTH